MLNLGTVVLTVALGFSSLPAVDLDNGAAFKGFDDLANHYKCYQVEPLDEQHFPALILSDQFKESFAKVIRPRYLCNPVKKESEDGHFAPIVDPELHYVCFDIIQHVISEPNLPLVHTSNQFGRQLLRPVHAELICLPSKKTHV